MMPSRLCSFVSLVCAVFCKPPTYGQTPGVQVERLTGLADPLNDDWTTEKHWTHSKHQLGSLADWLKSGTDSNQLQTIVIADASATALRPENLERKRLAGRSSIARYRRSGATERSQRVGQALHTLVSPIREKGRSLRLEFKVVGLPAAAQDQWTTIVRYEAFSQADPGVIEQTAEWSVDWVKGESEDHPLIHGIDLLWFEEATRDRLMFQDCTRGVIRDGWDETLQFGADFWYGKIDAVGEITFFGHNGIAIGDVNGDGLEDLYVAMSTGLPNKLFVRQADGTVRDTAEQAGVAWLDDTKGVLFADMDNDGDQDLLCAIGPTIVLCKNDGTGRFDRFVSMKAPEAASFYSLCAADFDLDGDLDIYGVRYVHVRYGLSVPMPFHDANNGPPNHLLRNDGDDRYLDVTEETGLNVNNTRFSTACAWQDYDNDGDPDLYVTNDFGRSNLYRNDGGKFVDVAAQVGAEVQAAGMGVAWSDFDLDGDFDLYQSNMFSAAGNRIAYQPRFKAEAAPEIRREVQGHSLGNALLRNEGNGTFRDFSEQAGVRMGRWAWGSKFVDINNDGYDDIMVPNGFLTNDRKDDL